MHARHSNLAGRLRHLVSSADDDDGQLLDRFVADRDDAAFAALIRRHGPMVLGVCRRVVSDPHLADDAFQATCLVLARKARTVRPRAAVGNWLYGVAYRVALRARTMAGRRGRRETLVADVPDRSASEADSAESAELAAALDAEVTRLSDPLRTAVVLCELEGRPRQDVARQLGIPEGTLSSRLAAARKLLAERLARRGIILPTVGLAVLVNPIVPPHLLAFGQHAEIPARVSLLAREVFRAMFLKKLGFVAVIGVLALAGGSYVGARPAGGNPDKAAPRPPVPADAAVSKPNGTDQMLVWQGEGFVFVTPDGKEGDRLPGRVDGLILNEPIISPDGKRVAFTVNDDPPADADGFRRRKVFVRELDGKDPGRILPVNSSNVFWSPDGRGLYAVVSVPGKNAKERVREVALIDPVTAKTTPIALPQHMEPFAITPDGRAFVVTEYDFNVQPRKIHLALAPRDEPGVTRLTEIWTKTPDPRVSPDGTKIMFQDAEPPDEWKKEPTLPGTFLYDLTAKTRTRLAEVPKNALVVSYCWSPDGKNVAYTWRKVRTGLTLPHYTESPNDPKLKTTTDSFLVIADVDGKNPKTLLSGKAESAATTNIGTVGWR